jgi:signal transduction histidine kinase
MEGKTVRIPIRLKLAGALALPMLALIGVAFLEVSRADARADEVTSDTELAAAAVGPGSLIVALQDERNYTGGYLVGMENTLVLAVDSIEEARGNTDAARDDLEAFIAASGEEVEAAFGPGLESLTAELAQIRSDIDNSPFERNLDQGNTEKSVFVATTIERYTALVTTLIDGTSALAFDVDDPDLRTGVELVTLATTNSERTIDAASAILAPLQDPTLEVGPTQVASSAVVADLRSEQELMLDRSRGPYVGMPEEFVESEFNTNQLAVFDAYLATGVSDLTQILDASNGAVDAAGQLRDPVAAALVDHADGLVDDANQQKQTTILLAATLVILALGITLYASRSITNPLRSLTRQAADMASSRLPQAVQSVLDTPAGEDVVVPEVAPIAVDTRDEVADVAAALNTVQTSALDLAVEQAALRKNIADSFVNLGRRNQNLLDRQLEMITELERQEQQPERLEDLFLLDHLATRMRRNAESLLRLAGGGDTTNSGWGGPVPIIDLVRGALGEVEEYERVDVHAMEPALVQAAAGSDLAHAVAELVENALHFSPDAERVVIRGRAASDGGYTLAIIDQGMGMDDEQLAVANRRLAGEESFTVAPSRYLGHYIAGHLAAGIGLRISLTSEAIGGIVARVDIPAELLVDSRTTVDPYASAPAPAPAPAPRPEPAPVPAAAPASYASNGHSTNGHAGTAVAERYEPVTPTEMADAPDAEPEVALPIEPMNGGLTRRQRGANIPAATNVEAAFGGQIPADERPAGPASADEVASFLSSFNSGVERGRSAGLEGDAP